jgi:hypothetical protein
MFSLMKNPSRDWLGLNSLAMNRRSFLQQAMLAASALAVDPERLLWTPGKKTIFAPKPAPLSLHPKAFSMAWPINRFDILTGWGYYVADPSAASESPAPG